MPSLFELTKERLALQNKLESLDLDTQTIQDTLEGDSTALTEKVEYYGFVLRNRDGLGDAMKAEIARMQARYDTHTKRTDAIKAWLLQNMQRCGMTRIDCPAFSVILKTNPPSVVIDADGDIPAAFMRITPPAPPVSKPDKKAIMDAIKSGYSIPGCHIEQKKRVVIK
jgi:hypothetical protein